MYAKINYLYIREKIFVRKDKNMKKTLSIIIALCIVLSVCFFSVSATEVTVGTVAADYKPAEGAIAITDAAGFAAMTADGNYYLANDITIDASYVEAFAGTFDGNGKTITTSAPLFDTLQGTVKNLTVEGAIAYTGEAPNSAVIAVNGVGNVTFENIYNKASITGANAAGALLAATDTTTVVTAVNCRNDADITGANQVGGLFAYIKNNVATITNCSNYGKIDSTGNYAGGIISRFGSDSATAEVDNITITGCVNNGEVHSTKSQTGGMLAYLVGGATIIDCVNYGKIVNDDNMAGGIFGTTKNTTEKICALNIDGCINYGEVYAPYVAAGIAARLGRALQATGLNYSLKNCINYGTVYGIPLTDKTSSNYYAAGIVGYAYGGSKTPANEVYNCVNAGTIVADCSSTNVTNYYVSGVIGYVNSKNYIVKNCINAGTFNITGTPSVFANIEYNKSTESPDILNNYAVESYTGIAANDAATTMVTADQLASGEVAYLINEAAGSAIYYQAIGTDKAPVLAAAEDGSNVVEKKADGTFGNPVKEVETTEPAPDTTEPAPDTTEPGSSTDTGDSFVIFAIIAAISVLGVAVVAKRREN